MDDSVNRDKTELPNRSLQKDDVFSLIYLEALILKNRRYKLALKVM